MYLVHLRPVLHVQDELLLVHVPQPVVAAAVVAPGVPEAHLEQIELNGNVYKIIQI